MGKSFAAGGRIKFDFPDNSPEWQRIRKAPALVEMLTQRGERWVADLNAELHAAQAARKQDIEDGYTFYVSTEGDRAKLFIVAATARAQAHEAANQSILKKMDTSGYDVNRGTGQFKNPTKGFTGNA
jgi:lipocalin